MNRLPQLSVVLGFAALLAACDDDMGPQDPGPIEIRTQTTGTSVDPDGYIVVLDGIETRSIGINDSFTFLEAEYGDHAVELGGVASNCVVTNDNPARTFVEGADKVAIVIFAVLCDPAGQLAVTTTTTGPTPDPNGYELAVDGSTARPIRANDVTAIPGLSAGDHEVELTAVSPNCSVDGDNPRTVSVAVDQATPVEFSVSCLGALLDYLAFTSERDGNREIYVVTPLGTGLANLTNDPADDYAPAVSPNGNLIAFTSDRDGDNDIYVMNYDGTGVVNLTNNAFNDEEAAWSPDGSQIAFVSDRQGNSDIFLMNADGSGVTQITFDHRSDRWPTWSPDGSQIAFATNRPGDWDIYVMGSDGSTQRSRTAESSANERTPAWSPDGSLIAFVSDRDGNSEVYTMNEDGSEPKNLTNDAMLDIMPAWSPDGLTIAFATSRAGDLELYLLKVANLTVERLTIHAATDNYPAWSPQP